MRRLVAIGLAAVAALGLGGARADDAGVAGYIHTHNPMTKQVNGLTETSNPCGRIDPALGSTNGLDGFWIALPADAPGRTAVMESNGIDADVWFYRATASGCELIGIAEDPHWDDMVTPLTPAEFGIVPVGATHAIVDLAAGNGATFTFKLV